MHNSDLQSTFITPNWPSPANVRALQTTRLGGTSLAAYQSFNLGNHVNDNPLHVMQNRQALSHFLPNEPVWLNQVHGIHVVDAAEVVGLMDADASFTSRKNVVCVTMTADCLPILICDKSGTQVASIHAGWRSLCDGVIEATIAAMCSKVGTDASQLMAWFGPAIGPSAFEVGAEVRAQFIAKDGQAQAAFMPYIDHENAKHSTTNQAQLKQAQAEKWLGNIYRIATQRLNNLNVTAIYGGGIDQTQVDCRCTFTDQDQFFSYRRDGATGRMATLIWLT
jgi:polyphenol oxidase